MPSTPGVLLHLRNQFGTLQRHKPYLYGVANTSPFSSSRVQPGFFYNLCIHVLVYWDCYGWTRQILCSCYRAQRGQGSIFLCAASLARAFSSPLGWKAVEFTVSQKECGCSSTEMPKSQTRDPDTRKSRFHSFLSIIGYAVVMRLFGFRCSMTSVRNPESLILIWKEMNGRKLTLLVTV